MAEFRVAKWLTISQNDRLTVANHKNDLVQRSKMTKFICSKMAEFICSKNDLVQGRALAVSVG
jgi:hypothetical protein